MRHPSQRRGFTLIELLVVIAIIAVLVGLLLPAVQKVREAAARMKCQNHLKQLALGVHNFESTAGKLPPGAQGDVLPSPNPAGNTTTIKGTNWLVFILPQVEQGNVYNLYRFNETYNSPNNLLVGNVGVPIHVCPSGSKLLSASPNEVSGGIANNTTHYYGIMGPGSGTTNAYVAGGPLYPVQDAGTNGAYAAPPNAGMLIHFNTSFGRQGDVTFSDVNDGTSNTLMIGEMSMNIPVTNPVTPNHYLSWVRGDNIGSGATKNIAYPLNSTFYNSSNNLNDVSMGSNHIGGANFALGDGSVRFVTDKIDLSILIAAASINGKEPISLP